MLSESIISVGQLNRQVSQLLEQNLSQVWVKGEVSNFTQAASGHWYFTVKDERAAVRAVMFRTRAAAVGFVPRVGEQVEIRANVTLYEPRGDYQLQVELMRKAGLGGLHEAFLRLKAKLEAEGYFDPERKLSIPRMPKAVGVVTSLSAAALRDVLTAMRRRLPHVSVIIYPAQVQGAQAAEQLCESLGTAIARNEVDTLLLVRGGGSLEDLWCFNDESLARLIAASPIPIISGVGHETDFTIADFVADLRAPTPTAAAELAGVSYAECMQQLQALIRALGHRQRRTLDYAALRLDRAMAGLVSPEQRLVFQRERLAVLERNLRSASQRVLERRQGDFKYLEQRLSRRLPSIDPHRERLQRLVQSLDASMQRQLRQKRHGAQHVEQTLQALSPMRILDRGYAIVRDETGQIAKNALDFNVSDQVSIQLARGNLLAEIKQKHALL
ncbi:MAG TPA: exodeoxyribonuclease VII large subunit [Paenalcaligenes sp.]|nr:exodeoxyribonuclease VII large subunit [Paenalcaligenes sp.]